jgi:hypothetical protein
MLELMQCGDLSPDQQQLADAMQHCSRTLTKMLDGAITIPGPEAHLRPTGIGLIDLPGKIETTINMFLGWAARQSVQLGYSISADTPTVVLADGQRLQQVLNNLVSNAIKYAAGSSVLVRVSRVEVNPLKLKISVIDHGRRQHDDKQARDCHQVRQPPGGHYSSSGIGLEISREIAKSVGGAVEFAPRPGGGTSCSFIFPASVAGDGAGIAATRSKLLQRLSVLVIAGQETQETICCHLQRWGVKYLTGQLTDCADNPELNRAQPGAVIIDQPDTGQISQINAMRSAWPGLRIAVIVPFAATLAGLQGIQDVTLLRRPLTRDSLAEWLMACSLEPSQAAIGDKRGSVHEREKSPGPGVRGPRLE